MSARKPHFFKTTPEGGLCGCCGEDLWHPVHAPFFVKAASAQLEIDFTKAKLDAQAKARRTQFHAFHVRVEPEVSHYREWWEPSFKFPS